MTVDEDRTRGPAPLADPQLDALAAVINQLPVGVILAEAPSGRLLLANAAVSSIWRHPFASAEGIAEYMSRRVFHPDGRRYDPEEWPLARAIVSGETVTAEEIAFERGDGSRGTMHVTAAPIRQAAGALSAGLLIFEDVTEPRRATERLLALYEMSKAVAARLDLEELLPIVAARVGGALHALCSMWLIGDDGATLEPVASYHRDPERLEFVRPLMAASRGRADEGYYARVLRADRPLVVHGAAVEEIRAAVAPELWPYLDRYGVGDLALAAMRGRDAALGIIGVVRDRASDPFTEDDLALLQMLADRAGVAIDAARLYRGERQAREAAEMSVEERSQVLAMVSHDLRGPLSVITAYTELLQRDLDAVPGLPPTSRERLGRVRTAARRMVRQLDMLVDAAMLEVGQRLELRLRPVDVLELLRHVADEHHLRHRVQLELGQTSLLASLDPARIETAVGNVIDNALRYSPADEPVRVTVGAERDGVKRSAVIQVADRGIGIPPEEVSRLFTEFYRASDPREHPGRGLGLAAAARVIEQHGGTIAVASGEGGGTLFTIRLPLLPDSEG